MVQLIKEKDIHTILMCLVKYFWLLNLFF